MSDASDRFRPSLEAKTTCIRKLAWIAAWDPEAEAHAYLRDADLAFRGGEILQVGGRYTGPADIEVDGSKLFAMPGLINVHNHPSNQPSFRGVREELGNPNFYQSGLYDGRTAFAADMEDRRWNALLAYWEMLRSGVTTFVDMSFPYPGWLEAAAQCGMRAYIAPLYESQHWSVPNPHTLTYKGEPDRGRGAFASAMELIEQAQGHNSGRLYGMVTPMAVDTVDSDLLRDSLAEARRRRLPFQLHAGESVMEFLEMTRRNGMTQIQWLDQEGLLGPDVTIGHGLFLGHHRWLHWDFKDDLELLVRHNVSVTHSPTVFSRYGITLDSFGRYVEAGINMGIGTDTHPHNMIEEMRAAAIMSRVNDGRIAAGRTIDVFNAATTGGARILLREDIGRLSPGAKADIVLVKLDDPWMMPVYDPIRSLLFTAADRAVSDVYVDGEKVLENGRVLTIDIDDVARRVQAAQDRAVARTATRDHSQRTADRIAPLTLPLAAKETAFRPNERMEAG